MTLKKFYEEIGGNYEGTVARFLTEERARRFAIKFETDPSFFDLCAAVRDKNVQEAFRAAHTLKGVCQNLGFDWLYETASALTEIYRAGSLEDKGLLDELKTKYGVVMSAVRSLKNEG